MNTLFIVKIGGNIIDDDTALNLFLKDFATINANKILVHGGGKIASNLGEKLGIKPNYVQGRRITDTATLEVVTMVYGGLINKKIVALLQALQCNAIGLTGADANIIKAVKRPVKQIDYGFVGDISAQSVQVNVLTTLVAEKIIPIIAPLTHDGSGQILNTNADTIAACLAISLSSLFDVRLIYCFEKNGILKNIEDENSTIDLLTKSTYQQLLIENKLFAGILPKIDNAFAAIDSGVQEVVIGHAKHILKNTSNFTVGTLIK
jgi:acetylglutamate kinase